MLIQDIHTSLWPITGTLLLHPPHAAGDKGGDQNSKYRDSLQTPSEILAGPRGAVFCAHMKNHVTEAANPWHGDREAPGYSGLRAGHWSMFRQ